MKTALLGASLLLLTGCSATYDVTVQNNGSRPVTAELIHDPLLAPSVVLGSVRLSPGTSERIYAEGIDPFDPVELDVRVSGDIQGVADSVEPPKGVSTVIIDDGGVDSWTGIRVWIEQTPPGER